MRLLRQAENYAAVYDNFDWSIPTQLNMATQVCDRHAVAMPDATALIEIGANDKITTYTWQAVNQIASKLANVLIAGGVAPRDRVGVLLSQSIEAAVSHVAAWKIGAISIPLFSLFGEDALLFRLADSGTKVLITERQHLLKIAAIRDRLTDLETIIVVDGESGVGTVGFWESLESASDQFETATTGPDDPAYIVYTSGTTGNPKGALHGHRSLMGHMTGVEFFHDFFPQPGDRMWTPADWAWIGGLMNCLMGAWFHGVPVVAFRAAKYDPEQALRLMAAHKVRNTFMPPTALKLMRDVPDIGEFGTDLRTIACAGEPMGAELLDWGQRSFGLTFNEFYGQTECNLIVGNCQAVMPVHAGSMGRPMPGHTVSVIDADGQVLPAGHVGQIAAKRPDPVMMLKYWNNDPATDTKFLGDWLLTGDQGTMDEDGYLWFVGRDDDVITSAGYRIGPSEIEDCLTSHPAVILAAVIGVPDPLRTEAVKAFITLRPGEDASPALEKSIRDFVKDRLSPHEYPRHVEFVEELPLTSTGKIRRKELRDREAARHG